MHVVVRLACLVFWLLGACSRYMCRTSSSRRKSTKRERAVLDSQGDGSCRRLCDACRLRWLCQQHNSTFCFLNVPLVSTLCLQTQHG